LADVFSFVRIIRNEIEKMVKDNGKLKDAIQLAVKDELARFR
jgi:hypothetical protein